MCEFCDRDGKNCSVCPDGYYSRKFRSAAKLAGVSAVGLLLVLVVVAVLFAVHTTR